MVYEFVMQWDAQRDTFNRASAAGSPPATPLSDLVIIFSCINGCSEYPGHAYYRFRASCVVAGEAAGAALFDASVTRSFDAISSVSRER
jgi:hypothetical protein